MKTTEQIAKHIHQVYFGGNWTASNLKKMLSDVTWQQANEQVNDFNSILTLTNHIHWYVRTQIKVLEGGPLAGSDKDSFIHPPINSEEEWQGLQATIWKEAEHYISLIAQLNDEQLSQDFVDEKYGTYYRNIGGLIEHTHYHLGQIALIKKLI